MRYAILLIMIFPWINLEACDCGSAGPFLKTSKKAKLTAIIRVNNYIVKNLQYRDSMKVGINAEIIEILKGKEVKTEIRIFGDKGNLCRPYIETFPLGTTWVINLSQGWEHEESNLTTESEDDYSISNCGEYFLPIENKVIKGSIIDSDICWEETEKLYTWSLNKLKKGIKNPEKYLLPQKSCSYEDTYIKVSQMPTFKYGIDSLNNLIIEQLNIEPKRFKKYTESIYIDFIVEKNGTLTGIKESDSKYQTESVEKYINPMIDLLTNLKNQWIPGKHFGKPIRVILTYKFDFLEICKGKNGG
ncbi:hypothetical protein [Chondrinema litorale]|uniref:hypothetical protein n=1 Tax=Chondrinema litorale TaxID=2994555 RepID=UPI002542F243|nr:hypothetical protein [Chondrinema litorale]UZR96794.1 hypothetical protein OQ292_24145 [Chondrinema litorale]